MFTYAKGDTNCDVRYNIQNRSHCRRSIEQPTNQLGVLPGTAPVKGAPFLDDECVKLQLEVSEKVGGTHFVRTRMQ